MAKISRRAVASSSASSSSSPSTSSSTYSSSVSVNNIAAYVKSGRNGESSAKFASDAAAGGATVDPLRSATNGKPSNRSGYDPTIRPPMENSSSYPRGSDPMGGGGAYPTTSALPPPSYTSNKTIEAELLAAERDRIRAEFFATYDVMTGVRIAATLSGFFGLMVFLIVWKSRSSSNETLKVLKDPKMAAVAAVCMQEEEEREIQEAMVATGMSIYPDEYDAILYRRQRMLSLGNVSAPPMLNRGFRFSSVGGGGYSSLLEPPRRFSYSAISGGCPSGVGSTNLIAGRRKSGSEFGSRILSNYPMGSSFGTDDYFIETEDELDNGDYGGHQAPAKEPHRRTDSTKSKPGFLEVPLMGQGQESRRSSAMTCCSTDSSYLERRCSAFTLGLSHLPTSLQRKLSTVSRTSSTDNWDYYYPDIQVIQPTPKATPCPSERSLCEQIQGTQQQQQQQQPNTNTITSITSQSNAKFSTVTTTTTKHTMPQPHVAHAPTAAKKPARSGSQGPSFVRKHSIAYYDPQSAQSGRKQQIHSISADTVNVYPYNQGHGMPPPVTPIQSAPPAGVHNVFHFTESPTEELYLNVRRKVTVVELQQPPREASPAPQAAATCENNNTFAYASKVAAAPAAAAATLANSSSLSVDSTPASADKLNGTGSSVSGKAAGPLGEKRAPLASLSSFKISSLEIQDSEMRSLDEDSVFLDSVADTDEDMQQLSSDSEEASLSGGGKKPVRNSSLEEPPLSKPNRSGQLAKYALEKRFSSDSMKVSAGHRSSEAGKRARKALLERRSTTSASSSDRVSLIGEGAGEATGHSHRSPSVHLSSSQLPADCLLGSSLCTNSPPMHPRRAQLMQQYSDPQSLPTTTTTTTTTTTEDDTCSTLNTELMGGPPSMEGADCASLAGGSTTYTQHSSLNTIISFGREASPAPSTGSETKPAKQQQLPLSKLLDGADDEPCISSISDSGVNTRQPLICMPSSLKGLILRGTGTSQSQQPPVSTRSATNLSFFEAERRPSGGDDCKSPDSKSPHCQSSVMLELPLIRLPTDDSSDSSEASPPLERPGEGSPAGDGARAASVPGTSRKWSKETLF